MRLVFMGTPDFAVPSLQALAKERYNVAGVFTQPDRPAGRGKIVKPSPVKAAAEALGLPVFQPEKIKTPEAILQLRGLAPECIVVVAYGQILSKEILDLPARGCINVHASLLPRYRGAAPIHWAVMRGEQRTGVTTMLMDEGLDTGDILLQREVPITPETTTGELHDQLAALGGELLTETLGRWERGNLQPVPQTGETVYAPLLKREHERLDWSRRAVELDCQIRGLNPWPGAFTVFREENLKIWRSALYLSAEEIVKTEEAVATEISLRQDNPKPDQMDNLKLGQKKTPKPGQIIRVLDDGIAVQTGDGVLKILEVQPAGKRIMPAKDFFHGRHGRAGESFTYEE